MLYLQIASPKSSVLNFLDSNSFEVIISIFQRTEKVPDMERLHIGNGAVQDIAEDIQGLGGDGLAFFHAVNGISGNTVLKNQFVFCHVLTK